MNHLHVRSCYSLLESGFKLEDIIDHCLQKGFYHACLTEHNSLFSVMKFWHLCKEKGVHPIIGLETEAILKEKEFHFILLAKNDTGLKELYKSDSIKYKLDKSECNVYVDNNLVYSGRSHFVSIDSIGENGNTKSLTIHKDVLCLKPDAHYVSENIKVEKK